MAKDELKDPIPDWIEVIGIIVFLGVILWFVSMVATYYDDQKEAEAVAVQQAEDAKCSDPEIKGNISYRTSAKIYHVPGDTSYSETQIDENNGERMFCTTLEAEEAGWRAASN